MKFRVMVVPDSVKKNRWMVAIYAVGPGDLVGIPLRNASKKDAEKAVKVAGYAFEYALREFRQWASATMAHQHVSVEAITDGN
jgi:hypothetical protein